jgi:nicotinate-nucleotide pyrophosphorylase (carboxylating)
VRELPEPYASHLPPLLAAALAEDLPDLTGPAVFGPDETVTAALVVKAPGVLAGAPAFAAAFEFLDARCRVEALRGDGDAVGTGDEAARVHGPARAVLAAERTALNFVTRLSGVATLTSRFVDAVAGTTCKILDTRKTTPGWRALEKHAVRCGGGSNHRMGLYDAAMLKDTHLAAAGSITVAVSRVRERWGDDIELVVECADLVMVEEALACKVGHIMLDNMDIAGVRGAVALTAGRARLEVSGGVTLATVRAFAETGADFVSVGALTHSAPALDLSLKVRP